MLRPLRFAFARPFRSPTPRRQHRPFLLALVCAGVLLAAPRPTLAQQPAPELEEAARAIDEAETPQDQVRALIEYARLLNRAERYAEALDAVSEAAQNVGLPAAPELRPGDLSEDSERIRLILLHRAVAHEGMNQFPEARNDYRAFLALEDTGAVASLLAAHRSYLDIEATQSMTTLARIDSEQLERFYDPESSRFGVTVFPFHNVSETIFLTQVGYGFYGYLSHVLSLLGKMTDQPIRIADRYHIHAALDEVSLGRFYAETSPIAPPQVARTFGTDVAIMGTVDADPSGLLVRVQIASLSRDTLFALEDARALTSDPDGIVDLQVGLALDLADSLQSLTGFTYLDRQAFEDSARALAVGDFQRLFAYGRSVELSIVGDFQNAATTLQNASVNMVGQETAVQQRTRQALDATRVSLAQILNAAQGRTPDAPAPVADTDVETATPPGDEPPPRDAAAQPSLLSPAAAGARMLTLINQTALGASGIDDATTGVSSPTARSRDPRDPVEGALRTQQGQITVRVRVPTPPPVSGKRTP